MSAAGEPVLAAPRPDPADVAYVDGLKDECGLLVGRLLWAVELLTGRDLLAELLEPLAGDLQAVSAMQQGWRDLARAARAAGEEWSGLDRDLRAGWAGTAADRAGVVLPATSAQQQRQAECAELLAEQLGHLLEVSRSTAEVVCAALAYLDSLLTELLVDAALGPVGIAKAAAGAPGKVRRIVALLDRAVAAVDGLRRAVTAGIRVLRAVESVLGAATVVLDSGNVALHAAAGSLVDETAAAGFRGPR